jgi:drug/metabolite transporter (DMT)-like permease
MTRAAPSPLGSNLLCMASMLVWATAFPVVDLLVPLIPPVPLTAMRMSVGFLFMLPLWLMWEGPLARANWLRGIWIGAIGFGFGAAMLVFAQQQSDAVTVAVITAAMPVVGIAMECVLDGRTLTGRLVAGLLLSIAGGVAAYMARLGGFGLGIGALLALASIVTFSWGSRATVNGFPDLSPLGRTTITLSGAALGTIVLSLLLSAIGNGTGVQWSAIGWPEIGALLIYGIGSMAISQLLWIVGVGRLGIGIASMHINAAPFYVMMFMFLLGNPWNGWQAAAALVVGAGVLLAQSGKGAAFTQTA